MSARLVGREAELGTLARLLGDAAGGRGRAAVVLGEPGIGKTALVEALAGDAAGRGVGVAWGRGSEVEAPPYWPWRQVLRQLSDRGEAGTLEQPPGEIPRAELFARVVEDLAGCTREAPALVVLEDAHWADPASLALLRFVVDALPGLPVLVVATARDDPLEAGTELVELLRSLPAGVERLALAGLGPEAITELVEDVLGQAPAADLVARIADRGGGNPFFVREVARLHASRGPRAEMVVPAGVQQVLERRLARLSQGCYELLVAAAVADDPDPELLAAVAGLPSGDVVQDLGEAVDARLLDDDGSGLSFAHALVREVIYGQQPAARRSVLHRRVAEALEERSGAAAAGRSALLGRLAAHWRRAPGDDVRRVAAERALLAARDARERMGFEQAVRFYRWALEHPPADELAIRIELGETQVLAGELTAGRATLREAARTARQEQRPADIARAVLAMGTGVGGFEVDIGDEEQITLLEDALAGLARSADGGAGGLRAAGLARLSLVTAGLRTDQERTVLADEAIGIARAAGDARTEVAALAAWCDARSGPDHREERLERTGRMLAAAERGGDPASLLLARRFRVVALAERGDFEGFDNEVAAYVRTSERLLLPLYGWLVPLWRGMRALMKGELAAVGRHLADTEDLAGRADSANAALLAVVQRIWLLQAGADHEGMEQLVRDLIGMVPDHPDIDGASAGFLVYAGQHDEARRRVRRGTAAGIVFPRDSEFFSTLWPLVDAVIVLDEREVARLAYDALEPYADRWVIDGIGAACLGTVAHQLGRLATFLGRHAEAGDWLCQALDAHRNAGASLLVSQTEAALAELAAARDAAPAPVPASAASPPSLPANAGTEMDAGASAGTDAGADGELRRTGRVWQVRWLGVEATVPDSKGMRDLAVLLAAPDREVHVLDLVEAAGGPAAGAAGGSTGERLDQQARAAYRQRLADLESELDEAEAHADAGRLTALRAEQEALTAELAAALGFAGRPRTDGDPAERARKAVTMRIRTALRAIAEVHPDLARHLDRSVVTGRFCAYRPEEPLRWRLSGTSR